MKANEILPVLWIFILGVAGCNNEEKFNPPCDPRTLWEQNDADYEWIKDNLLGTWNWKYVYCCGETTKPYKSTTESIGLQVTFLANGTLTIDYPDSSQITATWILSKNNGELFALETKPAISQLSGSISFCADYVGFYNSYLDGADNYFQKVQKTK